MAGVTSSTVSVPSTVSSKIKPVKRIIIENENVPTETLPNGDPAPTPFRMPLRCRIYPTMLSCYTSWNCLTFLAMIASLMGGLVIDLVEPECLDKMGLITVLITMGLGFNAILGVMLCLFVGFLVHGR